MANLRSGTYGNYYGSYFNESEVLSSEEMHINAGYVFSYLTNNAWSINAISAMLGNMQAESSINPGRWQNDDVGNVSLGYGLVQWTPSTKYTDWCNEQGLSDSSEMDSNLARILYEVANGIQWYATDKYNISFLEFTKSTDSVESLAAAFLLNYERPADQSESVQAYRGELATAWYTYLTGQTPETPTTTTTKKRRGYKFFLFGKARRNVKNRIS